MVTASPSVESVIDAVYTAIAAISSIGTVVKRDHTLEDDVEWLKANSYISSGTMNLWVIELESTDPFEGDAAGEQYDRYEIRIRYWSLRTGNVDWSREARIKAQSVADTLTDLAAIFAIGGNSQLFTPTTVRIQSHGPREIRDGAGGQMIYETVLALQAEARRWA